MRAQFSTLLFAFLAACSASSPPKTAAPDPQTGAAIAVEDDDPDTTASHPTLRDSTGALSFVRDLCAAAKKEDWSYVREHTRLPLWGQEQVGTSDKPLRVAGLIGEDKPEQFGHRAVCKYLKETTKAFRDFRVDDAEAQGVVSLRGHDYRIRIELDPPRLVEQKLLIPDKAAGDPKLALMMSPQSIVVNVRGRGSESDMESFLSSTVQEELEDDSSCAREQAARERISASLAIEVRTQAGRAPQVDLYASTVTDARFLGCLQHQLIPLLQRALHNPKEKKRYQLWLMIGIPVPADDSEGAAVISGPE